MKKVGLSVVAVLISFSAMGLILITGIFGGGSSAPIPTDEAGGSQYQLIGSQLNIDWSWCMLIDMIQAKINGEKDLSQRNPVETAMNCMKITIDIYTEETDEDDETYWEYDRTETANGAAEIRAYFGIPDNCNDVTVVANAISNKNSNEYRIKTEQYGSLEEVISTYYDFDPQMINDVIELRETDYLVDIYGDPYGNTTGNGIGGIFPDFDDLVYAENGMEIPLYYQYQEPWAGVKYGGGTIQSSGCSVTCIAMVFSYLFDKMITPPEIVAWTGNRYHTSAGASWSIFPATANQWGIQCHELGKDLQAMTLALSEGRPVIASMGPGTFTQHGHFIVLRGITADGEILVNDPSDNMVKMHFYRAFPAALIQREAKYYWSFEE